MRKNLLFHFGLFFAFLCVISFQLPSKGNENESYAFLLQTEDTVRVRVFNNQGCPEVDVNSFIDLQGFINLPLIGMVKLQGKPIQEAEQLIASSYSERGIRTPKVQVIPVELAKKDRIAVLGGVKNPGLISFRGQISIIDVIKLAGGLEENSICLNPNQDFKGSGDNSLLQQRSDLTISTFESAKVKRGGKEFSVNINKLFNEGDMTQNVLLKPSDVLLIPKNPMFSAKISHDQSVYFFGEVKEPGEYNYLRHLSPNKALSLAGGLRKNIRILSCIILRLSSNSKKDAYALVRVAPRALNARKTSLPVPFLQKGDLIIFSTSSVEDFQRMQIQFVNQFREIIEKIQSQAEITKAFRRLNDRFFPSP